MASEQHKMHPDQADIDTELVSQLLREQMPEWADLPLTKFDSPGTSNAIFRLGDALSVRLPLTAGAAEHVDNEFKWVPRLGPLLPIAVPVPVARGAATEAYPWDWTVCQWLNGSNPDIAQLADPKGLASDLAEFVRVLHHVDMPDGPKTHRGRHPKVQDAETRAALVELDGTIDTAAATRAWEEVVQVPEWTGAPVWFHGDLMPGNLLVSDGRLSAVLDFGNLGIGDPAIDLIPAWNLLPAEAREQFHRDTAVDDSTWARGRGWALTMALRQLPYYENTNPAMVVTARHTIQQILNES